MSAIKRPRPSKRRKAPGNSGKADSVVEPELTQEDFLDIMRRLIVSDVTAAGLRADMKPALIFFAMQAESAVESEDRAFAGDIKALIIRAEARYLRSVADALDHDAQMLESVGAGRHRATTTTDAS